MDQKPEIVKKTPPIGAKLTLIILEENENIPPTGQPLGLNGKHWILKPGEEAWVPDGVLEILDHAVMSRAIVDNTSRRVVGYRDQLRYPYRVLKRAKDVTA